MAALRRVALVLCMVGLAAPVCAQDPDAPTPSPVELHVSGIVDLSAFAGFATEQHVAPRGVFDLNARVSLARIRLPRASIFGQYYAFRGRNGSTILGDYEGFSSIDADPFAHAGELSLDVDWLPGRLRTRMGRLDANSDFALPISTELFQHSSAGFSGAIYPMPTYPNPEPGVVTELHVVGTVSLTAGWYEGPEPADAGGRMVSPGAMWLLQTSTGDDPEVGRVVFGAWRHTGGFLNDREWLRDSRGWFLLGERVAGHVSKGRSVVASAQASFSIDGVAPVRRHVALGLRLDRATQRRARDSMGMRLSFGELTATETLSSDATEMGIELFHRFTLNTWLSMQPDIQWLRLPVGTPDRDRFAMTIRLKVQR